MVLFFLFLIFEIAGHGFSAETLLATSRGLQPIKMVGFDDQLCDRTYATQHVDSKSIFVVPVCVKIKVSGQQILCSPDQRFWSVESNGWVTASRLYVGNRLLSLINSPLEIESVDLVDCVQILYGLSVANPHDLLVGMHHILAHNIAPFIGIGLSFAWGGGIEFLGASLCVGFAALGSFFGAQFFKNRNKDVECRPVATVASSQPPFHNFNKNDDDEKHPHGKYEGVDYHKSYQSGRKSPAPKNGQKALDNSVPIQNSLKHRVSVCDGEIVILRQTGPNQYHGYTTTWKNILANKMENVKNTLLNNNLVRSNGKIYK